MPFFDEYDLNRLKEARNILNKVYEYNYSTYKPEEKKLLTVIKKLDAIIENN